ncbi:hypothetical protein ALO_17431 [Acetonema longum DSM 6540]|uniref:Uncharacterized protein n=2 Tax=Acetonema TaxID=2373 RepID=F7NN03_9FIRM|nr:hypothetical protein ALO_17431 [Acetonema longum DSM 6540]
MLSAYQGIVFLLLRQFLGQLARVSIEKYLKSSLTGKVWQVKIKDVEGKIKELNSICKIGYVCPFFGGDMFGNG